MIWLLPAILIIGVVVLMIAVIVGKFLKGPPDGNDD